MNNILKKSYIGDICDINLSTYSPSENWKFVNYLDTGNITKNKIENIQYIDLNIDKLPSRARRKVKQNNIIYSTVRPNQMHYGILTQDIPENFLVSTGFAVLDVDSTHAEPYFVYYSLIQDDNTTALQAIAEQSTSAYPSIKPSDIKNREILLPPLETQQKIAKVLSAIDDKIELNNSINNNLEQQAQAIFKENISKNCNNSKNGCIGDYCAVKSGFAFKGSWWQNTGIKVIKIKTIDNDNINFNDCSYVSEDKIQYAKDFIVKGGDLLIAMTGATIGKFAIVPKVNETILVNQRVGKFFLGENPVQNLPFLYCTLKEQDVINEIINKGQGSAQPNISGSDIMNTLCYFPEKQNIVDFNNLCTPIFEKIINNKYENYHLIKLRDTLLPKLMSGEIDVSKVEIDDILTNQSADKLLFSILVFEHFYIKIVILIGITINTMTIFTSNIIKFKLKKSFTFDK